MFVINVLRKTAGSLAKSTNLISKNPSLVKHALEIDELISSVSVLDSARLAVTVDGHPMVHVPVGLGAANAAVDAIEQIYRHKFNKSLPADMSSLLRENAGAVHIENVVINNTALMGERADSYERLLSMVMANTNGYKDSMDNVYKYLSQNHAAGKPVVAEGKKYSLIIPAGVIGATGTAGYIFYKAIVKSICDNNMHSGCVWTRPADGKTGKRKCKIVTATCAAAYKHVSPQLPDCGKTLNTSPPPSPSTGGLCADWSDEHGKSICNNCTAATVGVTTGSVACVEPPNVGTILTDALNIGFDDINSIATGIGTVVENVLKYAHYGFLVLIALFVGFIYNRLRSIGAGIASTYSESDDNLTAHKWRTQ